MDNWREGQRTGHTHEPNDATIQLDGLGRQLAELPGEPAPPDGSDGPVFVDESGRRSKTYRRLGWVLASACVAYAVTLVLAVLGGNSSAPWLPLSGTEEKAKAEQAEEAPAPDDTADGASGDTPEPGPSASGSAAAEESGAPGGATPSATSVLVPAGSAGSPSASTSADPSRSTGTGGAGGATKPDPTTSTAKPPVDPTPPSPEPEPSDPTSSPAETPDPPVQEESAP
ncbi:MULTISPECIES: hypothetical protein [Streptomyces]|uniref:hypothetical protein n=1 Tax=Streptomyces TaxID=1883 RepID=UPI000851A524|nr:MULTISPECIES: hypothetical protein [unclassified Streptomyces]MDQ0698299.1 hypothetical protein [Streptomyces sp. W4I9-2]MDX3488743.1 hypothetical protein [Streptomyces sp. ID05-18]